MSFRLHYRGWRDGFHGREPREACEVYLTGWEAGHRASDRTIPPARRLSSSTSPAVSVPSAMSTDAPVSAGVLPSEVG